MISVLALVAAAVVYSAVILRWSYDFQRSVEPWLRRLCERLVRTRSEAAARESPDPSGRGWSSRESGFKTLIELRLVMGTVAMLLPVLFLLLMLCFRQIPSTIAFPLLAFSFFLSSIAWMSPMVSEPPP